MNDEEEAAFVDSFFLPGGILDLEDDEDGDHVPKECTTKDASFKWDTDGPPENPWANEAQQRNDCNAERGEPAPTAAMAGIMSSPLLGGDGMLSRPAINDNNGLSESITIGNASFEPTRIALGPLHESPLLGEPLLHQALGDHVGGFVPPLSSQQHLYPPIQPNVPLQSTETSRFVPPPPGFTQPQPTIIRIEAEPTMQPVVGGQRDMDEDDDSIRSDSSVPHELYDRESLSASSLSDSSSIDESSLTHNTSSILEDTPNTSSLLEDSMELEITRSKHDVLSRERPDVVMEGVREDVVEKSSAKLSEADAELEVPSQNPKIDASPPLSPSSPVNKTRSRRTGKAKRHKSNTSAPAEATAVCVTKQQVSNETWRATMDWLAANTNMLIHYLLTAAQAGLGAIISICKGAATFWMSLLRICKRVLFFVIRVAGVMVSTCVLVCHNAILEAMQNPRAAFYFAIMYFTPHCMSMLMNCVILPHWVPHLVSYAVLYGLCKQPYNVQNNTSSGHHTQVDGDSDNSQESKNGTAQSEDSKEHEMSARDVCRLILRQIRLNIPMMLLLEGFSHEIGTVMTLNGPGRLITAFVILILRLGLLVSPTAWLCIALQVLMASYMHWIPLIDLYVVLVGLASIRLIIFLDQCNQAAKDIRAKEK